MIEGGLLDHEYLYTWYKMLGFNSYKELAAADSEELLNRFFALYHGDALEQTGAFSPTVTTDIAVSRATMAVFAFIKAYYHLLATVPGIKLPPLVAHPLEG